MRRPAIFALSLAAGLVLTGCSKQTQQNAEKTAESAGQDVGGAAVKASDAIDNAAHAVGRAADKGADALSQAADSASASANRISDKVKEGADKARTHIHEETAPDKDK